MSMAFAELFTKPINEVTFAVVDTETTGMSAKYGRVMDIGIVLVRGGEVMSKWESLVDPEQEVPYWITHYTHLTSADVVGKPVFNKVADIVNSYLTGSIFVGHNVGFDYSFLKCEMERAGKGFFYPKLCTVMLGRKLLPQLANAHLDALADFYEIKISQRHRALPDAEATAIVLTKFIEIAREKYGARTFFDLERLQRIYVDRNFVNGDEPNLFDYQ